MRHYYSVAKLVFLLAFSFQIYASTNGAPPRSTLYWSSLTDPDSLVGTRAQLANVPQKQSSKTNTNAKNSRGILQDEHANSAAETFAPMNSYLRGYREMVRGFREMEHDEILALPQISPDAEYTLQAYPNPASHVVKIKVGNGAEVEKIEIYDASGTLKNTWKVDANPWKTEVIELNTGNLSSGTYTLRVYSNGIPLKPTRIIISR